MLTSHLREICSGIVEILMKYFLLGSMNHYLSQSWGQCQNYSGGLPEDIRVAVPRRLNTELTEH